MAHEQDLKVNVLVVGASGFIGSALAQSLRQRGHAVTATSSGRGPFVVLDISDLAMCKAALVEGGFDAVVNLAGRGVTAGSASSGEMLRVNSSGAETLATALTQLQVPPPFLVHVASSTEPRIGDSGESAYSESKSRGSAAIRQILGGADLPFSIARVHNTYGAKQPEGRFIMSVMTRLQRHQPVTIVHPKRVRDFCYIDDVALRITDLLEHRMEHREEVDIGTGVGTTLWEAAKIVAAAAGAPDALISPADPPVPDSHPYEVADSESSTFLQCTTSLSSGMGNMMRSLA
jgi:nucleoside-diphosphate-sugar epimerase